MSWALWFVGLWPIFSTYSTTVLIVVALAAVAWFFPILRKPALFVAGVIVAGIVGYSGGIRDEGDRVREQWRESLRLEKKDGEKARSEAERTVARDTPDILRRDPRNRDNWARSKAGAGSPVRGLARP